MRVMPSGSDVADKAVSTEDATGGVEVARLEAVLAALVETKVEAIKASTSAGHQQRSGSAPASPRRPRLTSSSTGSSSQNNHHGHHGHHGHHHPHHPHRHRQERKARHHRRHGSAPCGDYIEDPVTHRHKQRHGESERELAATDAFIHIFIFILFRNILSQFISLLVHNNVGTKNLTVEPVGYSRFFISRSLYFFAIHVEL